MRKIHVLLGIAVFIIILFVLNICVTKNIPAGKSEVANLTSRPGQIKAQQENIALYNWKQQQLNAAVKAYFEKAIAAGSIVGAGVSIVKGDSIVVSSGFGKRNAYSGEVVNSETVFRLGSLSKGFAGILAADLKNEGKLDWDIITYPIIPI